MPLASKDAIYGGIIILLITSLGLQIDQPGSWYYCEVENSLRECSSLAKYGVVDSKCSYSNDVGVKVTDVCTADKKYYAWKNIGLYVDNVEAKDSVTVEALQACKSYTYNDVEKTPQYCIIQVEQKDKCLESLKNGSCIKPVYADESIVCGTTDKVVIKNGSTCTGIGYQVNFSTGQSFKISGDCCGYFNSSPYREFEGSPVISCKAKYFDVCNPVIQQTSSDYSIYDEPGRIYVLRNGYIEQKMSEKYDYIVDNDVYYSKLEVAK